jgi:hypothetical protein
MKLLEQNKKPIQFLIIASLILGLGSLSYFKGSEESVLEVVPRLIGFSPSKKPADLSDTQNQNSNISELPPGPERIQKILNQETPKVGVIDPNPEATLEKLKNFAKSLTLVEAQHLKTVALDVSKGGDERFFSVYLLSLDPNKEFLPVLKEVVQEPIDNQIKDDRIYEQEVSIRAQALESIGHESMGDEGLSVLQDIISNSDNVSILTHARRILQQTKDHK